MSNELDALGRSLHHAGVNLDRTTLGVAMRELEKRGYCITPTQGAIPTQSTPQFHVQPVPNAGEVVTRLVTPGERRREPTKGGPGRV